MAPRRVVKPSRLDARRVSGYVGSVFLGGRTCTTRRSSRPSRRYRRRRSPRLLVNKGLRNVFMRGPRRRRGGKRVVGPAFTLRFIPAREDLATPDAWSSPRSTRAAIEDMPRGLSGCRERARRHRRRHFRRHPLRPHGQARGRRADHRRRRARHRGRPRDRAADLVAGLRGAALGRRPASSRAGRSRSAAAASRSIPAISSSPTTTARSWCPRRSSSMSRRRGRSRSGWRPGSSARSRRAPAAGTLSAGRGDARASLRGQLAMSLSRAAGVYAIAPTPFAPDGAVDFASHRPHDGFLSALRRDGLTILGVMGEAPKLDAAELLAVVTRVHRARAKACRSSSASRRRVSRRCARSRVTSMAAGRRGRDDRAAQHAAHRRSDRRLLRAGGRGDRAPTFPS